jgi:hypothetical protein
MRLFPPRKTALLLAKPFNADYTSSRSAAWEPEKTALEFRLMFAER